MATPKPRFTFGMYSLFGQGDRIKIEQITDDIVDSKFTGSVVHLMSPWGQRPGTPFYPYLYNNGVFLLDQRNELWYTKLKEFVRSYLTKGLDLELKLFDRYFELGKPWSSKIRVHPFRDNNINLKWTKDVQLFNSWVGGNTFTWIKWDDINNSTSGNWQPVGQIGDILFDYVRSVLDIIAEVFAETRRGRITLAPFNEQIAGNTDRHEIFQWLHKECEDRGLVNGRRFKLVYDYSIRGGNYQQILKGGFYGFLRPYFGLMELHSIGESGGVTFQDIISWGYPSNKILFSTDGVPAGQNKKAIQDLFQSSMIHCDGKQEEGDVPGFVWNKRNMMSNWDVLFPWHKKYLEEI